MRIFKRVQDCRAARKQWAGTTLTLVPTMGALHEGHLSLIRRARQVAARTVVSLYVNPLQFGPAEDFDRYPRPLQQDLSLCEQAGVDIVFLPSDEEMWGSGASTVTQVLPPASLTDWGCGLHRPGHFTGVATIVLKLLNIVQPDLAIFGEKDAQQLAVIRQMVRDLNLPVEIVGQPTLREADGLAMSSRNRYLTGAAERQAALTLSALLSRLRETLRQEGPQPLEVLERVQGEVLDTLPEDIRALLSMEYLEARRRDTLEPVEALDADTKVLIAARVGSVRLIDNLDLA